MERDVADIEFPKRPLLGEVDPRPLIDDYRSGRRGAREIIMRLR